MRGGHTYANTKQTKPMVSRACCDTTGGGVYRALHFNAVLWGLVERDAYDPRLCKSSSSMVTGTGAGTTELPPPISEADWFRSNDDGTEDTILLGLRIT
jgi:hypothetical protein